MHATIQENIEAAEAEIQLLTESEGKQALLERLVAVKKKFNKGSLLYVNTAIAISSFNFELHKLTVLGFLQMKYGQNTYQNL
jgi:hypothetical protein